MGEVYRARDSNLGREVAIKILPPALVRDAEHLARFEREARLLASLNHPGIATIHGIERGEEGPFLVLELIEGETLSERLAGGPMPIAEALEVCRQVTDALGAAHDRGVIHRDLKPANIKITPEGRVKVLDFGLAKGSAFLSSSSDSISPTVGSDTATRTGTIIGTPAYMSPEQARGKSVDKRTDMWSFGCVLYETLTGRRAFAGETVSDSLVAILEREPDWSALPSGTPASIQHLLHRCLEKDPNRRLRDAGDARLEIEDALAAAPASQRDLRRRTPALVFVSIAAAVVLLLAFLLVRRGGTTSRVSQPKLAQLTFAEGIEESPAWSRDGARLAYTTAVGGLRKIFLKTVQTGEERQLTSGDFDDIQPVFSPDGQTILFVRSREAKRRLEPGDVFGIYDGGDVWSIETTSGKETRLVEKGFDPDFAPDGKQIALDASWAGPRRIWIVDARGHNPQQLTTDQSETVDHVRPRWSPDGRRIVFQNIERTKFAVRLIDVPSKSLIWITNDQYRNIDPVWSPSGRFVYFSSDRTGGLNLWRSAVNADGTPSGLPQQLTSGAGQDIEASLSHDGRRLAFAILKQNADIWRLPVTPETGRRTGEPEKVIASSREDSRGAWSPDGKWIAFNSDRSGEMNIWLESLENGSSRELTKGPGGDFQSNWSPGGDWIAFFSSRSGNADIWKVEVKTGKLVQLTRSPSNDINPFFSPDGRQIAYQSDQGGRLEVWVMNADGTASRQLTRVGVSGHFLRWTRDGSGIVFRCPCGGKPQTLQVPLNGGEPTLLAESTGGAHISFSPDFSRIMDVVGHKTLWVSPVPSGQPEKVFEFEDRDMRIDYPVWSPDGRWVLFDRFHPQGGDIWMMEDFE
jgi:Tol biopolymer transport system component